MGKYLNYIYLNKLKEELFKVLLYYSSIKSSSLPQNKQCIVFICPFGLILDFLHQIIFTFPQLGHLKRLSCMFFLLYDAIVFLLIIIIIKDILKEA